MRCKVIGRDFDRGCEFLQGTYNSAAFDMALWLQKITVMNIVWTCYYKTEQKHPLGDTSKLLLKLTSLLH